MELLCRIFLCGGLGNQLFQFAFGRALALRSDAVLELDAATLFRADHKYRRSFELDAFTLTGEVRVRRRPLAGYGLRRRIGEWRGRGKPFRGQCFVNERRPLGYYQEYRDWVLRRPVSIVGYWQCARYFEEIEDVLRKDLTFREPLCRSRAALASEAGAAESVAVHVRRAQFEPRLEVDYYEAAFARLRAGLRDPRFYVFTDDPDWWRAEGDRGGDVVLVHDPALPAIEDFKLMSQCRHFIIGNSSFSWWAAWLGAHPDKQVIAPAPGFWLNPETVPEGWTVIESRRG